MTTTTTPATAASGTREAVAAVVLIADSFEASGIEALRAHGYRVESRPALGPDTLPDAVAEVDPHVLIVRSTKVPAAAIERANHLGLIVRAGAGYDNIDVEAASGAGVFVANCPGKNAIAVAELAWGLILACDRRIPDQTADLRSGRWAKKEYAKSRGLYGRTLGIVGLGTIGSEIARRGRAFGMKVIAWSRSQTPESAEEAGFGFRATPLEVARDADVVSISVALNDATRHLVDAKFLDAMRDGAILVNTSRGAVVDESALADAIGRKGLRVGADVWERQPAPTDESFADPLIALPGVFGTHHCGASTDQAQQAIAAETVRVIRCFVESGVVPNCVNRETRSPATFLLTVRHLNRPGVLAHVFRSISESGINVEEMENVIYAGARAACARIRLDDAPGSDSIEAMRANPNVLSVDLSTSA